MARYVGSNLHAIDAEKLHYSDLNSTLAFKKGPDQRFLENGIGFSPAAICSSEKILISTR